MQLEPLPLQLMAHSPMAFNLPTTALSSAGVVMGALDDLMPQGFPEQVEVTR
jgi:hypothetical protein